jgi:hypothetical protein
MSDANERKLIARIADQDLIIRRLIGAGNDMAAALGDGCAHDEDGCDACVAAVAVWDRLYREIKRNDKAP